MKRYPSTTMMRFVTCALPIYVFCILTISSGGQSIGNDGERSFQTADTSSSIQVSGSASNFTPAGVMLTTREDHTETVLKNGKVLIVGGMHWARPPHCFTRGCFPQLSSLASAEIYDPATGRFTATGSMSVPRVFHTATLLGNGKVLVAGGDDRYSTTYASAELYDPATGLFALLASKMTTARSGHTATLLMNGKVLLAGGGLDTIASAEVFDPATEKFTRTGSMHVGRFFFTATLLGSGRVLVAGGVCDNVGCTGTGTSSAELFNSATGTFARTGSMSVERSSHTATLLDSGLVLVAGGGVTAELYNPRTGAFARTGSMHSPRELHTATRLPSGNVLVTGGDDENATLSSAELFQPATGRFTPAGVMEVPRSEHAAALLENGKVLITGGINTNNGALDSLANAELFP